MIGAIDQATAGLQAGFERMTKAADRLAGSGAGGDLAGTMVDTLRASEDIGVNATVIRALDQMTGCLLDELA